MVDQTGQSLAMAEKARPRSALADAAERLSQLARTAGERQMVERGALRFPVTDVYSMSPDEEWSKKFMSQGIGPVPECAGEGGFCPMPFTSFSSGPSESVEPNPAPAPVPMATYEAPPAERLAAPSGYVQIGQAIGRPLKRRWWRRSP
jgi:hypothetical protein